MKTAFRIIGAAAITLAIAVLLYACASQTRMHDQTLAPSYQAQLDALQTPQGVDPVLFQKLKDELERQLAVNRRSVSNAPTGPKNAAANIHFTDVGGGYYWLEWDYRNIGDYNQDQIVGIADITPLAMHFGHSGADGLDAVVDGSGDGTVGIEDITPIAQYYGTFCSGYRVMTDTSETGSFTTFVEVRYFSTATGGTDGWKHFVDAFNMPDPSLWFRVIPWDEHGGPDGEPSAAVQRGGGFPPSIVNVLPQPLEGMSGTDLTLTVVYDGDPALSADWNFGGAAVPSTSTDMSPTVTLGPAGSYPCTVKLTNAAGNDVFDFTLVVTPAVSWTYYQVVPGTLVGDSVSFAFVNGKPAFAYINANDGTMHYAYAATAIPANPADWTQTNADDSASRFYQGDLSLAVDGSLNPVILALDSTSGDAIFLGSSALEPSGPSDWAVSTAYASVDEVGSIALANGVVCATLKNPGGLHFIEAVTYPPTGLADWSDTLVDPALGAGGSSKLKYNADDNNFYAIAHNYTDQFIYLARCPYPDRNIASSWVVFLAASNSDGFSNGDYLDLGFDPAAGSNNFIYIWTTASPDYTSLGGTLGYEGTSDLSTYSTFPIAFEWNVYEGQFCSLAFGGGHIMSSYRGGDPAQLVYSASPYVTDWPPSNWVPEVVPDSSTQQITDTNILVYNDTTVEIVYGRADGIYFASIPIT